MVMTKIIIHDNLYLEIAFAITLAFDVNLDTFGKVTKHNAHDIEEASPFPTGVNKATGYKDQTRLYNTHQHEA